MEMSIPVSTASIWHARITIDSGSLKNLEVIMDTEPGSKLYIHLLHISQLFQKCFQMGCLYFKAMSIKAKSLPVADLLIAAYDTQGSSCASITRIIGEHWRSGYTAQCDEAIISHPPLTRTGVAPALKPSLP